MEICYSIIKLSYCLFSLFVKYLRLFLCAPRFVCQILNLTHSIQPDTFKLDMIQ